MGWFWAIVIGFIAGVLAKLLTPGDPQPRGFILTTVLGIAGAVVGTFLGQAVGIVPQGDTAGFIGAVIGAIVILLVWRQVLRPR